MPIVPKLSIIAACRVTGLDRDRLNEHISAGRFPCAPNTTPGRARYFDPDDMVALWLFKELTDDGVNAAQAGKVACSVAAQARENPDVPAISYVEDYFPNHGSSWPHTTVPSPSEWDKVFFSGSDIRKVTTFNIRKIRAMIEHYTEVERSHIGPEE